MNFEEMKRGRGRRAIAPIIVTVLVVSTCLVASLATGGFVFGVFGTSTNSAEVEVTAASLRSADFLPTNTPKTFSCGAATGSFITILSIGTAGTSVTSASITWAGQTNSFTLATGRACSVGATGSATATQNIRFVSAKLLTKATSGGTFIGSVNLANGAVLLFTGTFQQGAASLPDGEDD